MPRSTTVLKLEDKDLCHNKHDKPSTMITKNPSQQHPSQYLPPKKTQTPAPTSGASQNMTGFTTPRNSFDEASQNLLTKQLLEA